MRIQTADKEFMEIPTEILSNFSHLADMQKIFIFDCCLGRTRIRTPFMPIENIIPTSTNTLLKEDLLENSLVAFSTSPGFESWSNGGGGEGSWFIRTFYNVVLNYCQNLDVLEIMDLIAEEMKNFPVPPSGYKQVPTFQAFSFEKLYLPKICYKSPLSNNIYFEPVKRNTIRSGC